LTTPRSSENGPRPAIIVLSPFAIIFLLEVAYPDSAINGRDTYRAIALGQKLPRRATQLIFMMRAIEVVSLTKERVV
jgi:hypothetical protein